MRPFNFQLISLVILITNSACRSNTSAGPGGPDAANRPDTNLTPDADRDAPSPPLSFVAVTFNTGISEGAHHDYPPDDGFSSNAAQSNADHYGNGLAWKAAIADTRVFFETVAPDIVAFQEIFHPVECADVPSGDRAGFVCETWMPGDPLVTQMVLGMGYQVACNAGHPDKCIAVKLAFGTLQGCPTNVCLDGLVGAQIPTCGRGTRIARGVIELVGGGTLTLVSVHGSSGFSSDEMSCRKKQFAQIFVDLDGTPAAVPGQRNLILGDFNTDPARLETFDESAASLGDYVGVGKPFHFLTEVGTSATPTYKLALVPFLPAGLNIDHVISDKLSGSCWSAGVTPGHPPVTAMTYFDHTATVCNVTE